jgi:hypothetical protein
LSSVSLDLFTFLSAGIDGVNDGAFPFRTEGFFVYRLEEWESIEMSRHPLVKIFDVGDSIDDATRTKDVCIFCEKGGRDDASFVFAGFEVGVGE